MIEPLLLPPELFPESLVPIVYTVLLPLAVIIFAVVLPLAFWFILMTPNARTETLDKLGKKDIVELQTETGTTFEETVTVYPEGFMIGSKTKNIYLVPRPIPKDIIMSELEAQGLTQAKIKKTYKEIKELEKITLNAGVIKGLGVRKYYAYQSVGVATTLAQLTGLDLEGIKDKEVYMAVPVVAKTNKKVGQVVKPTELVLDKNEKTKNWLVKVIWPVLPSLVQRHFNTSYLQTQMKALYEHGIAVGMARAHNPMGKWLIPILVIVVVVGVVILGATLFLGGGTT
jgi:hypothetical protein